MKPEWVLINKGVYEYKKIYWCKGCGCIKIEQSGVRTKYLVPRREKERRQAKRGDKANGPQMGILAPNVWR